MLDQRAALITAIPAAGLALGLGLWLALGQQAFAARADELETRLAGLAPPRPERAARNLIAVSVNRPVFALTTGPGAVVEPVLRLDGVSRSPGRKAALLSINGQAPQWVAVGATIQDVTLLGVSSRGAEADTLTGARQLKIGETSGPSAEVADPAVATPDQIPSGFRSPPPPATAPVMGG